MRKDQENKGIARALTALAGATNLALVDYQLTKTSSQNLREYMQAFPQESQTKLWDTLHALVNGEIFIIDKIEPVFGAKWLGEEPNTTIGDGVPYFSINPNMPTAALDIVLALWPDALAQKPAEAE